MQLSWSKVRARVRRFAETSYSAFDSRFDSSSGATISIEFKKTAEVGKDTIIAALEKYFFSDRGDEFPQLVERFSVSCDNLRLAWRTRSVFGNVKELRAALVTLIYQCNNLDVKTKDIRLRADYVNASAKIILAAIEILADNENSALEAIRGLANPNKIPAIWQCEFFANVALAELYIRRGQLDEALASVERNLAIFGACPTSQLFRYRILQAKKEKGMMAKSPDVYLGDLTGRFCEQPFETISTTSIPYKNGSKVGMFACNCSTILPYPINDKDGTLEEIWNGDAVQEIRRSILDGDFTYCSRTLCPKLVMGQLPLKKDITDPRLRDIIDNKRLTLGDEPKQLCLTHDASCNLACPSCRIDIIAIKKEERDLLDVFADKYLFPLMDGNQIKLLISGNGDPFGSKHYRRFIHGLDPIKHAGARLELLTNGLLLTEKEWESLSHIHHLIDLVSVSIDAATAPTYEDVRRPGKWHILYENMEFLSRMRRENRIPLLSMNFVVQRKNFEEMPAFVELGERWSVDSIKFQKIVNNGSYSPTAYLENNVVDEAHPLHSRFLEILHSEKLQSPIASLFNLTPYIGSDAHP